MMPATAQLEAAFGRHGVGSGQPGGAVLDRHGDVGDAVLVDAEIARLRQRRGAGRRARQMEGRGPRGRDRTGEGISAGDVHGETAGRIFRRQARDARRPAPTATPSSSTRSTRNSTRAWSRAATAGPAASPAASTCRRRRCSIPQTKAFVPLAEAEAKFAAQGVTKDKRVVAYCGGGISATIDLFLLHRLGYDNLTPVRRLDGRMGEGCIAADRDGVAASPPSCSCGDRSDPVMPGTLDAELTDASREPVIERRRFGSAVTPARSDPARPSGPACSPDRARRSPAAPRRRRPGSGCRA